MKNPIFIIGCGRSGTNLLFTMLRKHPQLIGTDGYPDGEDHVGWIKNGKCIISGLGSWASFEGGHTGFHYCLHMNEKDATADIIENMNSYYYNYVLKQDKTKHVVNKNPHLSNKLKYVKAIFPDAKFVHIVRDCLPVISSWIKMMEKAQPYQVLFWPKTEFPCFWVLPAPSDGAMKSRDVIFRNEDRVFPGKGEARILEYWLAINNNIYIQLEDCQEQLFTVRYEDLCNTPLETLKKICEFCEIRPFKEVPVQIIPNRNEQYKTHLNKKKIDNYLVLSNETRSFFGYK